MAFILMIILVVLIGAVVDNTVDIRNLKNEIEIIKLEGQVRSHTGAIIKKRYPNDWT